MSSGSHWLDTCADMLEPDADALPDVFKKASDSANDSDPSVADPICSLCRWAAGTDHGGAGHFRTHITML